MVRPLEEPLRTGHARRGGGGVDEAGGRLRRPGQALRSGSSSGLTINLSLKALHL